MMSSNRIALVSTQCSFLWKSHYFCHETTMCQLIMIEQNCFCSYLSNYFSHISCLPPRSLVVLCGVDSSWSLELYDL